jgi:hypothetical protein
MPNNGDRMKTQMKIFMFAIAMFAMCLTGCKKSKSHAPPPVQGEALVVVNSSVGGGSFNPIRSVITVFFNQRVIHDEVLQSNMFIVDEATGEAIPGVVWAETRSPTAHIGSLDLEWVHSYSLVILAGIHGEFGESLQIDYSFPFTTVEQQLDTTDNDECDLNVDAECTGDDDGGDTGDDDGGDTGDDDGGDTGDDDGGDTGDDDGGDELTKCEKRAAKIAKKICKRICRKVCGDDEECKDKCSERCEKIFRYILERMCRHHHSHEHHGHYHIWWFGKLHWWKHDHWHRYDGDD